MPGLRQIALAEGDRFIVPQGIIFDASTETYVRLRRTETLRFDGTPRKQHAYVGGIQITWLDGDHPDFRTQLTNWWANIKE